MKSLVRTIRRLVSRWRVDASLSSPDDRTAPLEREPFDPASIPEKFLYVRPGYNYVPTPSNYGGAPRERNSSPAVAHSGDW